MVEMFKGSVFGFQIISAQQLPKPEHDKPTSIVDPQVWVEVHGVPIDNNKKKTHHVNNNGEALLSAQLLLCSVVCVLEEEFARSVLERSTARLVSLGTNYCGHTFTATTLCCCLECLRRNFVFKKEKLSPCTKED